MYIIVLCPENILNDTGTTLNWIPGTDNLCTYRAPACFLGIWFFLSFVLGKLVGTKLAKLHGSLTGKRAFWQEHFLRNNFRWQNPCFSHYVKILVVLFLIQNLERFSSFSIFMGIRALEGGLSKIGTKLAKLLCRKGRFDRQIGDIERIFPACSAKKSKLFLSMRLQHFCGSLPLKGMPFLISKFLFF